MKNRIRFLVTSHGMTASHWFADCLNLHPSIYCSHDSSDVSNSGEASFERDEQYKRHLPLTRLFSDSEQYAHDKEVIGNVAGFILHDLYQKIFSEHYNFSGLTIVNMLRHPVANVNSFVALSLEMFHSNRPLYERRFGKAVNYLGGLAENWKVASFDLDHPEVLAFVQACHSCTKIARDMNYQGFDHVKMEDLVTDKNLFNDVVLQLTMGRYKFDEPALNEVFGKTVASHKGFVRESDLVSNAVSFSSDENQIFDSWESWQKNIFRQVMHGVVDRVGHNTIRGLYEEQDYDLSLLDAAY